MAKVCIGILDGFVGKVGTVVGSFWKGIPVMRAYKRLVSDRNNEAQQLVRTRFAAIGSLAGAFLSAIRIGLYQVARRNRVTEGDIFVKKNWSCIHAEAPGSATIDYGDLVIAIGNLPEAGFGTASFATPLSVSVPMSDTSEQVGADSHDLVYLFVYDPAKKAGVMGDVKVRADENIVAEVPAYWNGDKVHVWGFAVGAGPNNKGEISNSRYIGTGTIS
jgi:hypothetical protein